MTVRIEHDDCLMAISRLVAEGVVCDAVVTDAPYHLAPMHKRFGGTFNVGARNNDGSTSFQRLSKGFMGQQWDGGDIAFRPETWATIATILRPGAFLVAFGGTRTYHRLVCAIEDGGFVVQDQIAWMFGSGFPKRRDMLKPAWECIAVAQKPFNIQEPLCGLRDSLARMVTSQCGMATITALSTVSSWLDTLAAHSAAENTSTIKTASKTTTDWTTLSCCLSKITPESIIQAHSLGHLSIANASPAIRFFDASVQRLKTILAPSAAELATSLAPIEHLAEAGVGIEPICLAYKPGGKRTMQVDECRIGTTVETWPTSRSPGHFHHHERGEATMGAGEAPPGRWPANVAHDGSDEVLRAFPDAPGQSGIVTGNEPSTTTRNMLALNNERAAAIPRNDTGSAARFFYTAKADKQDRWGSRHPTVKPIDLIRWLVQLVTPPGGTVLDCFAGTGTTGVAALGCGRNAILIEREDQYVADIRERMAFYEGGGLHSTAAKARRTEAKPLGGLFERPYDESADLAGSYYAAVEEIGRRVKAGEPVPECMLKQKEP